MPHSRHRHLSALIQKTARFSPLVGVFGHRQVGKTHLAHLISEASGGAYVTLDQRLELDAAERDPDGFLRRHHEKGINTLDECQLSPALFPALKDWVRVHPRPGQFLLTGSVRFSSRRQIRESLAGRLISWELLPMDLSESHGHPLPDRIPRLLSSKPFDMDLKPARYATVAAFDLAMQQGGLPGIFSVRSAAVRAQRFDTILDAVLARDLRLLIQTSLGYPQLRSLLESLALRQGLPLEYAELTRRSRISVPTLKKLISAFESMFLIRQVPTVGTDKKPVIFFEDQGEATHLHENRVQPLERLTAFLYSQLRAQAHYRPELAIRIFQFRNRGGALIPLCFRQGDRALGIIPFLEETPPLMFLPAARSFLQKFRHARVVFTGPHARDRMIQDSMRVLNFNQLL